ncbi:MAG TPA: hypothetical protein VIL99_16830 [Ignavibacteria bacterium]
MTNLNKNIDRGQKIYRSVKFIGKALKIASTKGASKAATKTALKTFSKANIATAAIDATLSVIDACNSYINYGIEKEKTNQLKEKIKSEKIKIENLNKEISIYFEGESLKIKNNEALNKILNDIQEPIRRVIKSVNSYIKEEQSKEITNLEKYEYLNYRYSIALEEFNKLSKTQI